MQEATKLLALAFEGRNGWKIHWLTVSLVSHEGLTRFWVQSERGSSKYLVDLESDDGQGRCGCVSFGVGRAKDPKFQCKHCSAARMFLGKELVRRLLTLRRKTNRTRHEI